MDAPTGLNVTLPAGKSQRKIKARILYESMTSFFLVGLTAFILAILETIFVSLPLLFLWVIVFSMVAGEKKSYGVAFFAGLWNDFLIKKNLGETALFFLISSLVVSLYKRKFKVEHPFYFFPFIGLAVILWEFYLFDRIEADKVFWSLLMAAGLLKIIKIFLPKEEEIKI